MRILRGSFSAHEKGKRFFRNRGRFARRALSDAARPPAADMLTLLVCLCSIKSMKRIASVGMKTAKEGKNTP